MRMEVSLRKDVLILYDRRFGLDIIRIKLDHGTAKVVERAMGDIVKGEHSPAYLKAYGVADSEATF